MGGAVGVAVFGSIMASHYTSEVTSKLSAVLPPDLLSVVSDNVGRAAGVVQRGGAAKPFAGQIATGYGVYNGDRRAHGHPGIGLGAYLRTGSFIEATSENMESEFLQMGLFVLLTSFLYQRGSSESKTIEEPDGVDQDPREARDDPEAPWPVRRGGAWLSLYQRSLGIALLVMFLVAFVGHAIGGSMAYNEAERQHAGTTVTALGYILTSQFWFESFQNWQSEFFSVGVLVVMSIWLRQQGSAQSKPVAASASDTGE